MMTLNDTFENYTRPRSWGYLASGRRSGDIRAVERLESQFCDLETSGTCLLIVYDFANKKKVCSRLI